MENAVPTDPAPSNPVAEAQAADDAALAKFHAASERTAVLRQGVERLAAAAQAASDVEGAVADLSEGQRALSDAEAIEAIYRSRREATRTALAAAELEKATRDHGAVEDDLRATAASCLAICRSAIEAAHPELQTLADLVAASTAAEHRIHALGGERPRASAPTPAQAALVYGSPVKGSPRVRPVDTGRTLAALFVWLSGEEARAAETRMNNERREREAARTLADRRRRGEEGPVAQKEQIAEDKKSAQKFFGADNGGWPGFATLTREDD
jgi:hypothetical protein